MLYRPQLGNGDVIKLSWPIALFRITNNICWPLEDNPSTKAYIFDRVCWLIGFLIFIEHSDAELRYVREESANFDNMLSGVPTYLVLLETLLRAFPLGLRKQQFKKILQKFYTQIYMDISHNPQLFSDIRRKQRPTLAYSVLYLLTLLSFLFVPISSIINHRKEFLYKMRHLFNVEPLPIYLLLLLTDIWGGYMVVSVLFGQANLLVEMLLHINARFILLRDDLMQHVAYILKHSDPSTIAVEYQLLIKRTLQHNAELNRFLTEIQDEFSYLIFIMFSFSAALLCALCFIVYTNPIGGIGYIAWAFAKIIEMIAFGEIASTLGQTTDNLSSMYFNANWELILLKSKNQAENVRLMKLIILAMQLNKKPFYFSGLHFFSVSLRTVVLILQSAASYFTFLISFR